MQAYIIFFIINMQTIVAAQTFTVLAMVGGSIYIQHKEKKEKESQQQ